MGAAFGRLHRVPIIFTEHGSDHVRFPSSRVIEVGALLYDLTFGRVTIGLSTICTGASLSACSFVRRLTGKRAILLENAVNLDFWTEVQTTNYQRFVFVGRIASGKGWDIAISAHRKLDPVTRLRLPLILAGSGSEVESLKRELRGDESITYTGPLDQHGIRDLLKDSIMLNPTELAESLQTILIEAAACGAWILSSPTKEAASFLALGFGQIVHADWAAAMRDATTRLPQKPPKKILENYSWKKRAMQFFELLENHRERSQIER
jgi:glycosyltransferase involved in cell wall biosynthesis